MSTDHPAHRRRDRAAARAWLDTTPQGLRTLLTHLYRAQPTLGATTSLAALRGVPLSPQQAQGLAALLVGERYVRPVPSSDGPARYDARGRLPLGEVTLTRKGLALLTDPPPPPATLPT
ncbi:hypothetical protein [Deinococcus sp. Leaf326]|uniref:hypothetical protein n=1 Tax=Deinococcus sp. Leaf326 TaxID=1736338 RepID=UPI0006F56AA3|nr:hypothetical protein [Deinococcus sp. Leaf326]KQR26991.1 hypothetical protein ASF71_18030 [Deinococcus sp. Leaf326]